MVMTSFTPEKACGKPLLCPKLPEPPIRQVERTYVVVFIETGHLMLSSKNPNCWKCVHRPKVRVDWSWDYNGLP